MLTIERILRPLRRFDLLAPRPRLAAGAGVVLLGLLVPLLSALGGATGALGQSIPLLFLVPVLVASVAGSGAAGAAVACVAVVAWDWFFITPVHQVTIATVRDAVALLVFLLVALLVGQLATIVRRRTSEAERRANLSNALYDLSMALIARRTPLDQLSPLTERLSAAFDLEACAVLMPDQWGHWHTISAAGRLPDELRVEQNRNVAAVALQAHEHGHECRLGAVDGTRPHRDRVLRPRAGHERARFIPLRMGDRRVGVLELLLRTAESLDVEREHLLATFANGAAIALEQERLAREEQAAAVARESDRLKSALLSSVSHDLRTPLAGIKAAASSLLEEDVQWSDDDRRAFAAEINSEADRLTRLVSNLLDLSRIEAGVLRPTKDWEDVAALMDRVVTRLRPRLAAHPITCSVDEDLPLVELDAVQMEQVLTNLIENAGKYSPAGSPIIVGAHLRVQDDLSRRLRLTVQDRGPGIPLAERDRIFDKFYRLSGTPKGVSGTGMGLAIVKGLVEAHGGRVWVESAPGTGSNFVVELPIGRQVPGQVGPAQPRTAAGSASAI